MKRGYFKICALSAISITLVVFFIEHSFQREFLASASAIYYTQNNGSSKLFSNFTVKNGSFSDITNILEDKLLRLISSISSLSEYNDKEQLQSGLHLHHELISILREHSNFNISLLNPNIQKNLPTIRKWSSKMEYLEETKLAKSARKNNGKFVRKLVNYDNYKDLILFETMCLREYTRRSLEWVGKIAVVGSGPLPLTSVELLKHLPNKNTTIVNYDYSQEAVELGEEVVKKILGLDNRISFVKKSALEMSAEELADVDIVYLAALVGSSAKDKGVIIEHLHKVMRPGGIIIARSAKGLRQLIYQKISRKQFGNFRMFKQYDHTSKIILNSVVIGTKL